MYHHYVFNRILLAQWW